MLPHLFKHKLLLKLHDNFKLDLNVVSIRSHTVQGLQNIMDKHKHTGYQQIML